ncbi:MAG TPA: histidine-type phosphatase [Asticcacaulis sp.]|nr:histidine-type phosphatase [Asticcacaulis sp.]
MKIIRSVAALIAVLAVCAGPARAAAPDRLERVVILMRHGVRSAMKTPEQLDAYSVRPWPAFSVAPGELTPRGKRLAALLGAYYRDLYVREGLLDNAKDCDQVYYWANATERTEATAASLAEGLSPSCNATVHHVAAGAADPLFDAFRAGAATPDPERQKAAILARSGGDLVRWDARHRSGVDQVEALMWQCDAAPCASAHTPGDKIHLDMTPIALTTGDDGMATVTSPAVATGTLIESLLMGYADGQDFAALGWRGVDAPALTHLFALHAASFDLRLHAPEIGRQTSSYLAEKLAATLQGAPEGVGGGAPITVIVGHDGTLYMLAGLLGLDWRLPDYGPGQAAPGGGLVFEVWRSGASGEDFVRVRYVAQSLKQLRAVSALTLTQPPEIGKVTIADCPSATAHEDCSMRRFVRLIDRATK